MTAIVRWLLIAGAILAMPLAAAQQSPKAARVGFLAPGNPDSKSAVRDAFLRGMRDLGGVEGRNLDFRIRYWGDDRGTLASSIRELLGAGVDVIVSAGEPVIRSLKAATPDIPIVMTAVSDPVAHGFIASLAHPGGNITGLTSLSEELAVKRIQLLKEAMPKVGQVAILEQPDNPGHPPTIRNLVAAAGSLGLASRVFDARTADDLQGAFAAISDWRADATIVLDEGIFVVNRKALTAQAMRQSQPLVCGFREMAAAGCLLAYAPSLDAIGYRAASYVDKILKGAKPGDLPVEQPTTFELVINLKTARTLGLQIPDALLARADEVIE
jgi:putative ABC transport system substrate-binding protein